MSNVKTNKNRRKVLKTVGVAGSAAAVTAWTKPSLNAIVSPAHAQMSNPGPTVLNGSSSTTPTPIVMNQQPMQSIAKQAMDTLIPEAHAGGGFGVASLVAVTENGGDDNTHCISLTFDEAAPDTDFTFTLTGPTLYVEYCYYSSGTAYYGYSTSFSGMQSGTLNGQEFSIDIGRLGISGTVADDFEAASGVITLESSLPGSSAIGSSRAGNYARISTGYGAYWNVTLTGGDCDPGAGVSSNSSIAVLGYSCPAPE
jgi:hypothetical protein